MSKATETQETQEPREVRGLTEADYLRWVHHPVTKWFRRYLEEYRADLVAAASERWLGGEIKLSEENEMKGRALCLTEVATLPFNAIANFYDQLDNAKTNPEEDDDDARQAAEDDAG
jgi:hypothetical protein